MVFGLFEKKCEYCNKKIEGEVLEKFGKKFCSEEHARAYHRKIKKMKKGKKKSDKSCCH
ncbi:MAG: hypothetical protein ACE5HW_04000 [Candidatus Methanofastidiosia archaeon]